MSRRVGDAHFVVAERAIDPPIVFVIAIDRRRLLNRQAEHHAGADRVLVEEQIVLVQVDRRAQRALGFRHARHMIDMRMRQQDVRDLELLRGDEVASS